MRFQMKSAWLSGLVMVAVVVAGCADTEIQGVVQDKDMNTPALMLPLARGVNSEFADVFLASQIQWLHDGSTDAILNDGTTSTEEDYAVADYRERIHNSAWAQLHEAIWAVLFADRRMAEVYDDATYNSSNFVSRLYVYGGHAERMLGEMFCELIYNYGKDGGILLQDAGGLYDAGTLVPNDSAFKRAIYMYERALQFAEAGVVAGVEAPADETPGRPIFEPDHLVIASHAGLAQAYADLGDWSTAVQHARMVPDDWADWSLMDTGVDGGNDMADFFYTNDDMNMYRTPIAMKWIDDPRALIEKCGDWAGENLDDSPSVPPSSAFINLTSTCAQVGGQYRSESNRYPMWITRKYEDDSADIEVASGAEMRLIEAEAALIAGDLTEFTTQVNRARAVYGADPISEPATAGAVEYPNAEDDAWSILDRERLLELFGEARRAWDLRRWNHPFVTDNHVLVPRHVQELGPQGRFICIPIPDQECDTNPDIDCPNLASG